MQVNKKNDDLLIGLKYKLDGLSSEVNRIEAVVKNEIVSNRNESTKTARDAREEMSHSLKSFGELISGSSKTTSELQRDQLYAFSNNLNTLTKSLEEKLQHLTESNGRNINEVRRELKDALETMRTTIEKKVSEMQLANEKKLEEMRATVDEKTSGHFRSKIGGVFQAY